MYGWIMHVSMLIIRYRMDYKMGVTQWNQKNKVNEKERIGKKYQQQQQQQIQQQAITMT